MSMKEKKDIILITGGAGNMANAIINKYLKNDCYIISLDINSKENIDNNNFIDSYDYYQIDVTNVDKLKEVKNKIEEKYGYITHVISAAGTPMKSEFDGIENVSDGDIEKSIELNLTSHIHVTKTFLPLLRKDERKNKTITFVSSINALKNFDIPVYSAAKAGLYGFMYGIVKELGKENIRVNTISPGTIPTPIDIQKSEQVLWQKKELVVLKDFASTQDIADALYAITHQMKSLVGQNIVIDAGQMT